MKISNIILHATATERRHAKTALKYFIDNAMDDSQSVFVNRMDFKFQHIAAGTFKVFRWHSGDYGKHKNQSYRGKTGRWHHIFDIHTNHKSLLDV